MIRWERALWRLAVLDLAIWRRSPAAIAAALIPPLAMALLLYVLTLSVGRQPVALVVEDHGPAAQRMATILRSDTEAYQLEETSMAEARRLLDSQQVAAIIRIPADFDRAATTLHADLPYVLNNVDIDLADDIRRTVSQSVARFTAPQAAAVAPGGDADDAPLPGINGISVATTELRATTVDYLHYSVVPALILLVLSVGMMGTALLCAQDVERGTARHLAIAPVPAGVLVTGRLLGGVLAAMTAIVPVLLLGAWSGIVSPPPGHWPALLALFVVTAICASALGAALGSILRGARVVSMAASVLATYLFFLGGGFTTIQFLPDWLRRISAFVPIRYAIDGLRQTLFYPGLTDVVHDLRVLLATALMSVTIGALFVQGSWGRSQRG
ncbi:MAG: type transport system permease protein [Chloroflexota bacterium]|nr:type transport system permease protein [Chloroflexota bacterium]